MSTGTSLPPVAQPPSEPSQPPTKRRRLKWWHWALIVVGVLVVFAIIGTAISSGGGTSTSGTPTAPQATSAPKVTNTPAPPTATPKPKAWVTVQHFTGSQNQQTATFHVSDGMQVVWKETPTDTNANFFSIELYSATGNSPIDLIVNNANEPGPQSSTYVIHGDNDVYLKVQSDSVNYDIQVQAYK